MESVGRRGNRSLRQRRRLQPQVSIGSGPFRFVSAQQDKDVVVERNPDYWGTPAKLHRVEFKVIPDSTTRALELRKRSADVAINSLVADTVVTLQRDPNLSVMEAPGTIYAYIALNLRDPVLKDVRVRQAIAYAINTQPIIHYLLRDEARPAYSILPPQHWAYDGDVARYPHDPERARQLLDQAGYPAKNGVRFHITMKTSTEESTRLLAAVLQQQLREVGIALDIRSFESATFLADVTKGAYQIHSLRWIGGNQDPDMFENVFATSSFAPKRANRTFYSNPRVDELIKEGRSTLDQAKRKVIYDKIQQILADDLPYINLWYLDNVLVHTNRVHGIELSPAGNYDFLKTAELVRTAALKGCRKSALASKLIRCYIDSCSEAKPKRSPLNALMRHRLPFALLLVTLPAQRTRVFQNSLQTFRRHVAQFEELVMLIKNAQPTLPPIVGCDGARADRAALAVAPFREQPLQVLR